MCGIVGFVDYSKESNDKTLMSMIDTISHRGPDSYGKKYFKSDDISFGLGHRRLSILDLSSLGNQPMDYDYLSIVYNGEVYNFEEIKLELIGEGYSFISDTDTEVVLKAFHMWGTSCVDKFRGMFAFSIYDKKEEKIYIFRDRAGVKPLYFYKKDNLFLFGSELKSFKKHPGFTKKISTKSLPFYFRFGYIPAPLTIFEDTYKLKAGYYLVFDIKENNYKELSYWSVEDFYLSQKFEKSEDEILEELEQILVESFKYRMVSDVPVGVFLSGGIDSTIVTALLQKSIEKPLKTFTIGFKEEGYNEAKFAKNIANYLGTDHTEYYCTKDDMFDIIKNLPTMFDEPFGDSSAIPTFIVSKLAKEKVSVVLSGDGGDETFIGYSKYFALEKVTSLQHSKIKVLKFLTEHINDETIARFNNILPSSIRQKNIKDKYQKFKNALHSDNFTQMFVNASSYVDNKTLNSILIDNSININLTNFSILDNKNISSPIEKMTLCDYKTFMVDDVLTKVDRASMSVSLEAREPLLDHKIIEFIGSVKSSLKYKKNTGKYLLKQILYKYIPNDLIDRPKSGFQIPLYEWLKSDLKELVDKYLNKDRLEQSGIYQVDNIMKILNDYYNGKSVNISLIWFILMYEMWREEWKL